MECGSRYRPGVSPFLKWLWEFMAAERVDRSFRASIDRDYGELNIIRMFQEIFIFCLRMGGELECISRFRNPLSIPASVTSTPNLLSCGNRVKIFFPFAESLNHSFLVPIRRHLPVQFMDDGRGVPSSFIAGRLGHR